MGLRYGKISDVDYEKGVARVNFEEINIVSGWLGMPKYIRDNRVLEINTQVAVIMHDNGEDGEIIHERSNDSKLNTWATKDKEGIEFSDGTKIIYDNSTKKLEISSNLDEIILNCNKLTINGDIKATGNVKGLQVIADNGVTSVKLSTHTHPTAPSGPISPPTPNS